MALRTDTPARVLVTGASGFTGRYVVEALRHEGHEVAGWGAATDVSGLVEVDLTDAADVRAAVEGFRPQRVVHLAAISFVGHGDIADIYRVNVAGTRNLLEALALQTDGLEHVIVASSANIYGNTPGALDESTAPDPQNDYAISKLAMEYSARLWSSRVPMTITRPFNYTGVGQSEKFLIPKIVSHFRRGEASIELGNIAVSREFNDVRDVARSYCRLLAGRPGGVVNLCTGRSYALGEVMDRMAQIAGYQIDVRVNPALVRANEVMHLCGDPARLRERTGLGPCFNLKDTLAWMYEGGGA